MLRALIISFSCLLLPFLGNAQLVLNEACSKNNGILLDESGDTPDWVELYNGTPNNIDLAGYFLSDDPAEPYKWTFPQLILQPDSFLIVFASNRDTVGGELHTSFKLSRGGEVVVLTDPNGFEVDRLDVPFLNADNSFGKWPDAGSEFFFGAPTPNASNATVTAFNGYTPQPYVSMPSGFHDGPIAVSLSNVLPGAVIHYELAGDVPGQTSPLFNDPISIELTTNLRARAYADSLLPSDLVTNTYLIDAQSHLPVLIVSTPPENLWDSIVGIYVFGTEYDTVWPYFGANFWDDREIPVHVEFFDKNGELGFKQDLGMKIHGWVSARLEPQRPFRLHARKQYGDADIDYPIFRDRPYDSYKRIIVRNSGGDFNQAMFRDGLHHKVAIQHGLHVDAQAYEPVIVYLNGEYWGIMNLRERVDKYFLESLHNVSSNDLDLLEQDTIADEGDLLAFQSMYQFIIDHDMGEAANFEQAGNLIDLKNVADYFIIETFVNNTDWPLANVKMWRPREVDGKWRFILVDVDATLNIDGWVTPATDNLGRILNDVAPFSSHVQILKSLLENQNYREYFVNRYADLMNTTFSVDGFMKEMLDVKDHIAAEIEGHSDVWGENSLYHWNNYHINGLVIPAIQERPAFARQYVNDNFQLNGQVELNINVFPENAATIRLNTLTLQEEDFPWSGVYYNGVPVELTVVPNPGFEFKFWRSLHTVNRDADQYIKYNFEQDDDLVAYFAGESDGLQFTVYPNPTFGESKIHFYLDEIADVSVQVFDAVGKLVRESITQQFNAGINIEPLDLNGLSAGTYNIQLNTNSSVANIRAVVR